ncbi:MAG: hypothetical protein WKG06_03230 [Segetibacter sp.]
MRSSVIATSLLGTFASFKIDVADTAPSGDTMALIRNLTIKYNWNDGT